MGHCAEGGAWAIDYLSYLEDWVEKGKAPGKLIGGHLELPKDPTKAQEVMRNLKYPLQRSDVVTFTRPIFPYPMRAKYKGTGDPNDAANFVPVGP